MKRILLLIKGLGRGGAERIVVNAVRHGDRTRYAYEVAYLLPWKDALVGELEQSSVPVHCLYGARTMAWIQRLRALVEDRGIDLVHIHSPLPAIGARIALRGKTRLVYTEHNVWQRYHPLTHWANLLTYGINEHVFAVSDHVRVSAHYPRGLGFLRMPPIETVYHGPERVLLEAGTENGARSDLGIPDGVPVVGTVANLKAHKGHRFLLQAADRVRRQVPDVRFVLVGQGPMERKLRDDAHNLELDETVVFAGPRDDVPRLLGAFDIFVLPSIYEGLSIALIEAMAAGKPVIATKVGGIPEVLVHGEQGLVVPPADPTALSGAILTVLRDDALRHRFGQAGRVRAREFNIEKAVRRIEQVYDQLLTGGVP